MRRTESLGSWILVVLVALFVSGAALAGDEQLGTRDQPANDAKQQQMDDWQAFVNSLQMKEEDSAEIHEDREELQEDRAELRDSREELREDRQDLRQAVQENGAASPEARDERREIREDQREIREDRREVRDSKRDLEKTKKAKPRQTRNTSGR